MGTAETREIAKRRAGRVVINLVALGMITDVWRDAPLFYKGCSGYRRHDDLVHKRVSSGIG
jgi:hypothetical protein